MAKQNNKHLQTKTVKETDLQRGGGNKRDGRQVTDSEAREVGQGGS